MLGENGAVCTELRLDVSLGTKLWDSGSSASMSWTSSCTADRISSISATAQSQNRQGSGLWSFLNETKVRGNDGEARANGGCL